jgi:hypothetical protein
MSDNQSLTEQVTDENISSVRKQIAMKKGCDPYYGTINQADSVITDMDHFPYNRFYRGVYDSSQPVVFEREAGWRPHRNSCYSVNNCDEKSEYPSHCFEAACSIVYPCYPKNLQKIADRDALNVQLNNSCIVQYR